VDVIKPDIELHIDEVVLSVVPAADGARVAHALTTNLERLLSEAPLPALPIRQDAGRIDGGVIAVDREKPDALGAELARAIYRSLPWG
jgi:hypothetical protein